jgi:hypothetical protein
MQHKEASAKDKGKKSSSNDATIVYRVIFYICASIMIVVTAYALIASLIEYINTGSVVIGEVLVNTEVPFKGFAKPVTYLMISSIVGWYCVTRLGRSKTMNLSARSKAILKIIAIAVAATTLYELIYNFVVWNALMTADAISGIIRIDVLNIPYPNPKTPWSLVFATKMFLAAFVISAHAVYLISKSERVENNNNNNNNFSKPQ